MDDHCIATHGDLGYPHFRKPHLPRRISLISQTNRKIPVELDWCRLVASFTENIRKRSSHEGLEIINIYWLVNNGLIMGNILLMMMVIIWLMMVNNNLVGGWAYPSKKWWSSSVWDDEIPNWMDSHQIHVPNHQPVYNWKSKPLPVSHPKCSKISGAQRRR